MRRTHSAGVRLGRGVILACIVATIAVLTPLGAAANSVVTASKWMVTASNQLAAQAGAEILRQGGNAVDAAFATAAAIGVVEPWFSNILGGGSWMLYYPAEEKKVVAVEAVGPAPTGATPEFFSNLDLDPVGVHMANIPGAFDGWILVFKKYGTMSLQQVLAPALSLAENGFPVGTEFANYARLNRDDIARFPDSRRTFLKPDGSLYAVGERIRFPNLAATLRKLLAVEVENAGKGREAALEAVRDYFYKGELARALVDFSRKNKGLFTMEDFAKVEARFREPIKIDYRGYEVYECPPCSQGITMLMALNILEGYDLKKLGPKSPDAYHLLVEATKLAYADREAYVGDPDVVEVPVEQLLSKDYAARQRKRIELDRVSSWPIPGGLGGGSKDTTTLTVVDAQGNAISVTTSIGSNWVVMGDTGIVINNRMTFFNEIEGDPNQVAPGKKVRHTSNPAMVLKDGKPYILVACSGVDTQPQAQLQAIVNVIDFGMNPYQAVAAPRWVAQSWPTTNRPHAIGNNLALEPGFDAAVAEGLKVKGHKIVANAIFGNMSMILIDPKTGALLGGADPRRESVALGW